MSESTEVWKTVPGFPRYEVSDLGRVRSLQGQDPIILKTWITPHGYERVQLWNKGRRRMFFVHRLVLLAHVGPPPEGHNADHFPNFDPADNRLDNLRWIPEEENRPRPNGGRP